METNDTTTLEPNTKRMESTNTEHLNDSTQTKEITSTKFQKYIRILWIIFAVPFVLLAIIFTLVATGQMGFMPTFGELEDPKRNIASEILSSDQQLLGKYYMENRSIVSFEEISPYLVNALVATEDIRFREHSGIDGKALLRVAFGVFTGSHRGGGSTITQQLAKNLFPRDTSRYSNKLSYYFFMMTTKFKEWVTAIKLERNYTKKEIIVMYLNTVPFGSQAYGIKSASRTFFNASPDSLKIQEAAVLIGLLKAPSYYSPVRNPERSKNRRNTVFSQMLKYELITKAEFDSLSQLPIKLDYSVRSHNEGLSPYFREYLRVALTAHKPDRAHYASWQTQKFEEDSIEWETNPLYGWCNKNRKPNGEPYNLYEDGLKIFTTIDANMQYYAEEAVSRHLATTVQPAFYKIKQGNKKAPFSWQLSDQEIADIIYRAMQRSERYRVLKEAKWDSAKIRQNFEKPIRMQVFRWKTVKEGETPDQWYEEVDTVMTPIDSIIHYKYQLRAGFVSIEPNTGHVKAYVGGMNHTHFKYDHVKSSRRQVGSTFKPFIYSMAMIDGYSPCHRVANIPYSIEMPEGQPVYTPKYSPSKFDGKMITLRTGLALSLNQISAWIMKNYNPQAVIDIIRKMGVKSPIDAVPAICVGSAEVTLFEMVGAYGTFANKGVFVEPIVVAKIEDRNGNVLASFKPKKNQAINEENAFLMLNLMQAVVDMGTAHRLRFKYKLTNQIAGKTGTTNENSDAWFIGITPQLVSGAWVGGEERSIRIESGGLGQGASAALPIWAYYMQNVYNNTNLKYSKSDRFEEPMNELSVEMDCQKYEQEQIKNSNYNDELEDEIF